MTSFNKNKKISRTMVNNVYESIVKDVLLKSILILRPVPLIEQFVIHYKDRTNARLLFTSSKASKTKEYEGRKLIGFSMEQIFEVVADVENYKKFIPFCKRSDIISKKPDFLKANLVIGFPPLKESYVSHVTTLYPQLVKAECKDGRLFNHLNTLWVFTPGLKNNPQTCVIDFSLSFQFKSLIHSHLSNLFFYEIVRQMENAFIEEAKRRYGKPCIKTVRLER